MCTPTWKNQNRARRASTRPSTQVKKNVSPIRTNRLRKILLRATTPPSTVHRPASVRGLPVIVVAATEAAIDKTLAAAAAEDVLDAVAVAGAVAVAAVAVDSVPAAAAIFLRPNTLPRKVANLVAAIAAPTVVVIAAVVAVIRNPVVTIIVAPAVSSIIAAMLRALLHHLLQSTRRKNRSCCRANHSPNIVDVPCPNLLRRLPL